MLNFSQFVEDQTKKLPPKVVAILNYGQLRQLVTGQVANVQSLSTGDKAFGGDIPECGGYLVMNGPQVADMNQVIDAGIRRYFQMGQQFAQDVGSLARDIYNDVDIFHARRPPGASTQPQPVLGQWKLKDQILRVPQGSKLVLDFTKKCMSPASIKLLEKLVGSYKTSLIWPEYVWLEYLVIAIMKMNGYQVSKEDFYMAHDWMMDHPSPLNNWVADKLKQHNMV